ncbi:hypothetical protein H0G86_010784 [Trichoderma simmonsii]|uniref:Uncharacterized protein n=1 Tax=Trichoderma simmonsii TaxID=1491479 RepID=A0A8G0LQ56_9HYPO|nr:hypothetical protein H0G86_010784 [Trichoderma simmonsii]
MPSKPAKGAPFSHKNPLNAPHSNKPTNPSFHLIGRTEIPRLFKKKKTSQVLIKTDYSPAVLASDFAEANRLPRMFTEGGAPTPFNYLGLSLSHASRARAFVDEKA